MGWSLMVVTCMDFNPRSPDGERLAHRLSNVSLMTLFQSTLPGWGATKDGTRHPCPPPISIHAPRMGSDIACIALIWSLMLISIPVSYTHLTLPTNSRV